MSSPIERLAKFAKVDALSAAQAGEVVGVTKEVVYDLIRDGQLECMAVHGKGRRHAEHRRHHNTRNTYHITPRQCLAYIVRATQGERTVLMAEIELLLPAFLPFAKLMAKKADDARTPHTAPLPLFGGGDEVRGSWRHKHATHDDARLKDHPEMFPIDQLKRTA